MSRNLPVAALSVSAMRLYDKCPEKWRRRYVLGQYERPSGPMIAGSAAGAAANVADHHWMQEGELLDVEAATDAFADEWDLKHETDDPDWSGRDKPGDVKTRTAKALGAYVGDVLPTTGKPIAIEREARLVIADEEKGDVELVAYIDREDEDGTVSDRKVTGKKWSAGAEHMDHQADAYLAVRRAEAEQGMGEPALGFEFHLMLRQAKASAVILETDRSDDELDAFLARILGVADELEWRLEADQWSYAPEGAWWCAERTCGYWSECPGGGLYRRRAAEAVRNG